MKKKVGTQQWRLESRFNKLKMKNSKQFIGLSTHQKLVETKKTVQRKRNSLKIDVSVIPRSLCLKM